MLISSTCCNPQQNSPSLHQKAQASEKTEENMSLTAFSWFLLNILTIILLGFYSMQEMASVSFNRLRLQYYVSKGIKRAIWVQSLLQNPARLFGTTLISVNIAMFIGSECARRTYAALGLNPDWAPLTQ